MMSDKIDNNKCLSLEPIYLFMMKPLVSIMATQEAWERYQSSGDEYFEREIQRIAGRLSLGDGIVKSAMNIYQMIEENQTQRMKDKFIAASIFVAARNMKEVVLIEDLSEYSMAHASEIRSAVKQIKKQSDIPILPQEPSSYVSRVIRGLDSDLQDLDYIEERAKDILDDIPGEKISGKNPRGFAAAAVWVASEGRAKKTSVTNSVGISHRTLNQRIDDIEN